ncbi:MAG: hypothetical protein HQ518_16310 [Rhodopirellula sp.]|nr:hypothetical protein [Rhodopirellula sp.]
MPEQLFDRLRELRQRVRYVLWVYGFCCLTVTFFLTTLAAGSLDWLWHLDEAGTRVSLGLGILGASGWVGWRFLWIPLTTDFSNVELASRIEKQNPSFNDSLSSTVQFLESDQDERIGSPKLQQQVIAQTLLRLDQINVERLIETRPVQKVATWAVATCVLVAAVVGFNQADAATAMSRLLFPFSSTPWPRDVELQFVDQDLRPLAASLNGVLTVVQGETLELFVENQRGALPADLTFVHRQSNGKVIREPMRQSTLWDSNGVAREIGGASLHVTNGPLFFWARGGDGETVPLQVDVVPPPRIDGLHVSVTPPTYTGRKMQSQADGVGHVEGVVGTKVSLMAHSNKLLESATLYRKDASPELLTVSQDGLNISGEFSLKKPVNGSWWLVLKDRHGFESPDATRYDLRISADNVPTVTIEAPATDQLVTAVAKVPFRVLVRDDIGIRSAWLAYKPSRPGIREPKFVDGVIVSEGPDDRSLQADPALLNSDAQNADATKPGRLSLFDSEDRPDQIRSEFVWDLTPYHWQPGTQIVVHAEASDWYDLGGDHFGTSNPRTLIIVSEQEKRSELTDRQAALLLDLERATATLESAHQNMNELKLQLEEAGSLRPEDHDVLKRVELDQRQVQSRLTEGSGSLQDQAKTIQQERSNNAVEDAASKSLLDSLVGELEFFRNDAFPKIEQKLTEARKLSSSDKESDPRQKRKLEEALDSVSDDQKEAIHSLRGLLNDLSQWRNERNLNADLRSLTSDQQELTQETAQVGQKTLTRSQAELTDQERADLAKLAARQQQVADEVDAFREQLKQTVENANESQPDVAEAFKAALDTIEEASLSGEMRQAANDLGRNRVGDAVSAQQKIIETMRKVQNELDQRHVTDTETLMKRIEEGRQDLAAARSLQESLQKKVEAAGSLPDQAEREQQLEQLRREQKKLREGLEETLRKLERLQSSAAGPARRAAGQMDEAESDLATGNADAALEKIQETLDDLEQAERELAADQKEVKEQLAREQLEKLGDQLASLLARQKATIGETQRLQLEFEAAGKWSRVRLKSLRNLTDTQQNLLDETTLAAENVGSIQIVALSLRGATRYMQRAIEQLDDRNTGEETVVVQQRVVRRFDELLKALVDDDPEGKEGSDQPPGEKSEDGQPAGPEGDIVTLIAQLKVIRSLQQDLADRFHLVRGRSHPDSDLTEADQKELRSIAQEQALIADLVRELTSEFGDPEPEPEADASPVNPDAAPRLE